MQHVLKHIGGTIRDIAHNTNNTYRNQASTYLTSSATNHIHAAGQKEGKTI